MNFPVSIAAAVLGLVAGVGCGGSDKPAVDKPGVVNTTSSTMSYAECQKSAEYPGFTDEQGTVYSGGRYAVEYDNGVCTVQKP